MQLSVRDRLEPMEIELIVICIVACLFVSVLVTWLVADIRKSIVAGGKPQMQSAEERASLAKVIFALRGTNVTDEISAGAAEQENRKEKGPCRFFVPDRSLE